MTALPLAGKLALVTGGSGSIGSAIAVRFARDGASVLVHYNTGGDGAAQVVREIGSAGGDAERVPADLNARDGPATLLQSVDGAFGGRFAGRLDVLVNNAGIFDFGSLTETTDDDFDRLFTVNVRALFQLSREAARRMTRAGWGRIINIGSVFGEAVPSPGMSVYSGTKFAVQGLTRAWSRELGPLGITVNCLQPALIQAEPAPDAGPAFEAMRRFASVGRFGSPHDIAGAAAFLAGPQAAFINGAVLNVDGGWGA